MRNFIEKLKRFFDQALVAGVPALGLIFVACVCFAGVDPSNKFKFGDGTTGADKTLEFNIGSGTANPKIKYSISNAALQFANDGVTFTSLGSGGSSNSFLPQELLLNPRFDTDASNWTASGGTKAFVASPSTNVGFAAGSMSWDPSAGSQSLVSNAATIPESLKGKNGYAYCSIKTTSTDVVMQVWDGSTALKSKTITGDGSWHVVGTSDLNFVFPSSGTVAIRFLSASNSAIMYVDDCHLGDLETESSPIVFKGYHDKDCTSGSTFLISNQTPGTFTDFVPDPSCTFVTQFSVGLGTVTSALSGGSSLPGIVFTPPQKGLYKIEAQVEIYNDTPSEACAIQLYDGTNVLDIIWNAATGTSSGSNTILIGYYDARTSVAHATIRLRGYTSQNTGNCVINAGGVERAVNWNVEKIK